VIQEFHLSVTPVGNSQYLIRTERVPYGAPLGEEQVTWAVGHWLEQARQLMGDPLQGILKTPAAPATSRSALSLIELGQELFAALFQGTLRYSWAIAQGVAQSHREPLRLRLGLKGLDLPRLPWEVMYGTDVPVEQLRQGSITAAPQPLATGTRIIFSRYQLGTRLVEDIPALSPHQPLRILMVVSAPSDREQLKLHREVQQMQQELEALSGEGGEAAFKIQLKILSQPGREELARTLEQGQFQVLHYAGHSDLSADGGSLYLVNNRTGLTEVLTGDDLAGLLVNNGIRLALFNSCRGAHTAASNPGTGQERNLAEALVSRGIPAVLAMAEQIPDNVALNLTIWFYRNLKLGFPIDMSLNRARQALVAAYSSNQFYWALPVLYLHPDFDGHLISRDRPAPDSRLNRTSYGGSGQLRLNPTAPSTSAPPSSGTPAPVDLGSLEPGSLERRPVRSSDQSSDPHSGSGSRPAPDPNDAEQLEETAETDRQVIAQMLEQLAPPTAPGKLPAAQPPSVKSVETKPAEATVKTGVSTQPTQTAQVTAALAGETAALTQPVVLPPPRPAASGRGVSRFLLLPTLGAVGLVAYAALYGIPQQRWQFPDLLGRWSSSDAVNSSLAIDPTASVEELRAIAQDYFKDQQPDQAIEAVKLLLEKGALTEASEAIAAAPTEIEDDTRINFLRGRLAWQGMKAKDGVHTLEQAITFWESAVSEDPDRPEYQRAMMFAYYSAGDPSRLEQAIQSWYAANNNPALTNDEVLDFKAMAALVLQKRAAAQPDQQRNDYLLNAVQLYEEVMRRQPQRFSPTALQQNWLWTETAIKEWQTLGQVANPPDQKPAAQTSPPASPASPAASPTASPPASSAPNPAPSPASPQPAASAPVPNPAASPASPSASPQ
jgi:tetratricopeptide (TPR) repeat protein